MQIIKCQIQSNPQKSKWRKKKKKKKTVIKKKTIQKAIGKSKAMKN